MMAPLPVDEIVRELKRYRYDFHGSEFGGARVPIKTFGDHVGISRQMLNRYIHREGEPTEPTRRRLTQAIQDIRSGRLRFERRNRIWQAAGPAVEEI
jgi:hypothetical protein